MTTEHTTYETATTSNNLLSVCGESCTVDAKVFLVITPGWHARSASFKIYGNLLFRSIQCRGHIHNWRLEIVQQRPPEWDDTLTREEYMTLMKDRQYEFLGEQEYLTVHYLGSSRQDDPQRDASGVHSNFDG